MKFQVYFDNLKRFFQSKPPIALFTLAIIIFAFGSACTSFYVKNIEIKVADAKKDWNIFLDKLPNMMFCVGPTLKQEVAMETPKVEMRSVSFPMTMIIQSTPQKSIIPHNIFMTSAIDLTQLGIRNSMGHNIPIEISLEGQMSFARCFNGSTHSTSSKHLIGCDKVTVSSCVTVRGPVYFMPSYNANSHFCEPKINSTSISLIAFKKSSSNISLCDSSQPMAWLNKSDFVMYLSLEDKAIISLHLFHTSFFLFIIVFMILTCAVFRDKSLKVMMMIQKDVAKTHNGDKFPMTSEESI